MSVSKQNSDESSVEENGEAITEDDERLKGDAIGDTLYSESWILKTLMKLTEELPSYSKNHNNFETQESNAVELDESLETDLCLLWDMSADKEVAHCLFQHDILSLAKCVIEESVAPRLTEIGIGILANLSCQQKIGHEILLDSELLTGVVNLMSSEDSQTIIQIVRLLDNLIHYSDNKSYHYSKNKSCSSLLDDEALWMSVAFILENSLKEELLIGSAKLLENLTRHMKHDEEVPYKNILSGIIEAQKQLQSGNSDIAFDYPLEVRDSFVALVSAFYNFSRHKPMQIEIVNARDRVDSFLSFHFSFLLKSVCDSTEEELASLTASAVQAVTIFFITFSSAPLDCKILELVGHVGSKLEPYVDGENELSKCASDYSEIVGDCFRKQLDLFAIDYFLGLLESLNTKALAFILQAAHRTVPDRLQQVVDAARSRGSFNKVIETYESCVRNAVR
ncbi:protein SAAL1-like isoform X1 [Daphnia magna]|uniref:protein SAAL1-like isoform X1 n=1 Tax=Daphnia magna TaxID=35525 RepID=UPI001E1BAAEE|nr:protein SAAL1-like isoform X1 [Daphnia magna]XP_045024119.1 protein SAAL1-like isoform X1 [Daphnia magna]